MHNELKRNIEDENYTILHTGVEPKNNLLPSQNNGNINK
jgi:hypothetical protein